ncbi:GNAT family N-acetyltransferase [bacterium]|nr:GNAT family N-acetyltransferase [bacterium]
MEIRLIEKTDLPEVVTILMAVYNGEAFGEGWTEETAGLRIRDLYETPGFLGLVYEAEGQVQGFVLGHVERGPRDRRFFIREMCVRPDRQRQGIGTNLVRALLEDLVKHDISALYIYSATGAVENDFLRGCGFFGNDRVVQMIQRL